VAPTMVAVFRRPVLHGALAGSAGVAAVRWMWRACWLGDQWGPQRDVAEDLLAGSSIDAFHAVRTGRGEPTPHPGQRGQVQCQLGDLHAWPWHHTGAQPGEYRVGRRSEDAHQRSWEHDHPAHARPACRAVGSPCRWYVQETKLMLEVS
jgi:hypothetical protein